MSNQEQLTRGQQSLSSEPSSLAQNSGMPARDIIDDVLGDFFGSEDLPVETIGGEAQQRPELRTMRSEEFVRRFRQETGQ
ncbi:MAG: hypothetical protein RML95_09145 [Anaerolineae bacterium]|nr:hypothetical protein [Anaerolineae bacterium]MDW8299491.1 hypothetical protein [Anaerolineae bacterium]